MENGLSASDIALLGNEGMGGNSFLWIFALLILANGGFGFGNNRGYDNAVANNEILSGQKFANIERQNNAIGDGIASLGYALQGQISNEGRALSTQFSNCCCENQRNIDALRYDLATQIASVNANVSAQSQAILNKMAEDKISTLQNQLNTVTTQQAITNALCGVPKVNPYLYGITPTCNCQ